jgi:hypothetical protein
MMVSEVEEFELRMVPCTTARILEMCDVREEQHAQLAVTVPLLEARMLEIDPDWSRCAVMAFQAAPIAAWGAFPRWRGRAIAWALFTPRAQAYAKRLASTILFHMEQLREREQLRRLEATVDSEDPKAIRWAQLMGLSVEGLLRAYGPQGEDYFMMARTWR